MPTHEGFWLNDQESLPPRSNQPCQEHEEDSIRLGAYWSFDLPMKDAERLA
jgi:hypothetical protein